MSAQQRRGKLPPWTRFGRATPIMPADWVIENGAKQFGITVEHYRAVLEESMKDEVWKNSRYQVVIDRAPKIVDPSWPKMIHLSIKRIDREVIHDWRDLQRIKNELVGPENEAIELYPAESRKTDAANQYHLFALVDSTHRFPLGWTTRFVTNLTDGQSKQRPFEEETP